MKPTPEEYAQALYDQLVETPAKQRSRTIKWFVETVKQHHHLAVADDIIRAFNDIITRRQKTIVIHLISAQPLHNLIHLGRSISQHFQYDIELRNYLNPQLIGGLVIRYRNYKIDLSVKSQVGQARTPVPVRETIPVELQQVVDIIIQNQAILFSPEEKLESTHIEIIDLQTAQPVKLSRLEKIFSAQLQEKIIIHYHQDPKLIGGAVIKYDHTKVDVSIDQALEEVKE